MTPTPDRQEIDLMKISSRLKAHALGLNEQRQELAQIQAELEGLQ